MKTIFFKKTKFKMEHLSKVGKLTWSLIIKFLSGNCCFFQKQVNEPPSEPGCNV